MDVLDCSKFVPDSYTRQVKEIHQKRTYQLVNIEVLFKLHIVLVVLIIKLGNTLNLRNRKVYFVAIHLGKVVVVQSLSNIFCSTSRPVRVCVCAEV